MFGTRRPIVNSVHELTRETVGVSDLSPLCVCKCFNFLNVFKSGFLPASIRVSCLKGKVDCAFRTLEGKWMEERKRLNH